MKVLITGASGFVGRALTLKALDHGWLVRKALLPDEHPQAAMPGVESVPMDVLGADTALCQAVSGMETVIHLAARVHIMQETSPDPLNDFRKTNTEGTIRLARQAADAGVKRFVFMSTIGVNGTTSARRVFSENDDPAPHNPYSVSKLEAEMALREISLATGMEVVIVRAPLVYGPGNPGNFLSLLRVVASGIPLPLASISNSKSLLYVGNLADALTFCAIHPDAARKTYLVSDGEDVSTPELIRRLASALEKPARLLPCPEDLIRLAGKLFGRSSAIEQLIGSLQVDSSKIQRELGWTPPFTMAQGLRDTAEWYQDTQGYNK